MPRIYLSPPDVGPAERDLLLDAFDSNWVAPLGPHVDAFEQEFAARTGCASAAALSSGTAALHLGLLLAGVGPGDDVLVSTFTFAATANAITYVGARPVFVDSERSSWNVDPELVEESIRALRREGRNPRALIAVDLYGQCADYDRLEAICEAEGLVLIEDAAEALGAEYKGRPAGSFGRLAAFSFNGNKIITTSGGGMLTSADPALVARSRFLASQAREPAPHYEHETIGFNYRMSNLLAAVGRGQLAQLDAKVARRREHNTAYREAFRSLDGITFAPIDAYGRSTCWLTCIEVDPTRCGLTRESIRLALDAKGIESRPVWKPMHLQPVFRDCSHFGAGVSDAIFQRGLCLPSGSSLRDSERDEVIALVKDLYQTVSSH
jgi:dTDP-4-amino-4,6-dideoxygalactose transaminase